MDNKSPEAFRTISEVADWLGVPAHVLRFWESRFGQVKPVKRAGGRRYYRPSDMELLGGIRKLLHDDGMTIRGVQKLLRENGVKHVAAMSPPIDGSGDLKDVSPQEVSPQFVAPRETEPERTAPVFDNTVEDAVELEAAPETLAPTAPPAAPIDLPAAAPTAAVADAEHAPDAQTGEAAEFAADEVVDEIGAGETGSAEATTETEDASPVFAGAPAPSEPGAEQDIEESTVEETAEDTGEDIGEDAEEAAENETAEDTGEPADALTLLDSPEAIEFYAHEAQPETVERAGSRDDFVEDTADEPDGPTTASSDTVGDEDVDVVRQTDDLTELAVSPDAAAASATGDFAATPDKTETDPSAPETGEPPVDDLAPTPATRAPAGGPDLVMPEIGPDPEDDAATEATLAIAAALRRQRPRAGTSSVPINPALLQAYADRLQTLSGRLGATPDGRRPF